MLGAPGGETGDPPRPVSVSPRLAQGARGRIIDARVHGSRAPSRPPGSPPRPQTRGHLVKKASAHEQLFCGRMPEQPSPRGCDGRDGESGDDDEIHEPNATGAGSAGERRRPTGVGARACMRGADGEGDARRAARLRLARAGGRRTGAWRGTDGEEQSILGRDAANREAP